MEYIGDYLKGAFTLKEFMLNFVNYLPDDITKRKLLFFIFNEIYNGLNYLHS